MNYAVKLLPKAYEDLKKAREWYNQQRKALGEEFKAEVNKEFDYICQYPQHYEKKHKEIRQSLIPRFPYAIFYRVEESKNQIIIFAVLHTSRNPEMVIKRTEK